MDTTAKQKHIGHNISGIRELHGIKQEALAIAIGVSQQTIPNIESSETMDDDKLQLIAKELCVRTEAIKQFSEGKVINYFNSFNESVSKSNFGSNNICNFNPLDKLVEAYEENIKLYKRLLEVTKNK